MNSGHSTVWIHYSFLFGMRFLLLIDLRSLDLSHNQLTQLPESFGDLINLEEIYANSNRLNIFPCFNQCARLKVNKKKNILFNQSYIRYLGNTFSR